MDLWILHADTPYRMYREKRSFSDPALHVNADTLRPCDRTVLCFAFWADKRESDEAAWQSCLSMYEDATEKLKNAPCHVVFSIEDARILSVQTRGRLARLRRRGIRILTPFWSGRNRFGGAHDTDTGLTPDGQRLCTDAMTLGMLLDVSHASRKSLSDMAEIARGVRMPLLATHSNFFAVTPHSRNLTDAEALTIAGSSGVIGLSLVPAHTGGAPDVSALFAHIDHGIALGIGDALAVGGDFDGTDALAASLHNAGDLAKVLLPAMTARYGEDFTQRFFYGNALERLGAYLLQSKDK